MRVVGCLVEKQLTTPQQYPLSLHALVAACNQASNRDPVVAYDEATVESAVSSLKEKGLVRFVHPSHGRSVTRYRQVLDEALGLDQAPVALLAVLALRGPQTAGELRGRTERMASFAGVADVEATLDALSSRAEPLTIRLPREPGRKEARHAHLLGGGPPGPTPGSRPDRHVTETVPGSLVEQVAALRAEVAALRRDLDEVRAGLPRWDPVDDPG